MCLLGLKFFCKWADISDSEDCIFRRISSSPGNFDLFDLFSHVTETVNLYYILYCAKRWPISKGRELEIRLDFKRNGFAELYISSEGFSKPKVDVQVL